MEFNHHTKVSGNNVKQVLNKEFEDLIHKSLPFIKGGKLYLYDVLPEEYLKGHYIEIYDSDEGINTFYFKKEGADEPLVIGEFAYNDNQRKILMQQNDIYKTLPEAPVMSVMVIPFGFMECCKTPEEMRQLSQQIAQFEKLLGFILLTRYNVRNKIN